MAEGRHDPSLGELIANLATETSTLVRQELRQAGTELTQRVSGVGKEAGTSAVGAAALLHVSLLAFVAAIIFALDDAGLPTWLAALIVALVTAGVGYALIGRTRQAIKHADIIPHHAISNLKEDQQVVKEQVG